MKRIYNDSKLEKNVSKIKTIIQSFRNGKAHYISKSVFIAGGLASPFFIWAGNPDAQSNIQSYDWGSIGGILAICGIAGYLGNLAYNTIHYICFDLADEIHSLCHRPHPSKPEKVCGYIGDTAFRDIGFDYDKNND